MLVEQEMQKPAVAFPALIIIFLITVSSVAVITPLLDASPHPFYVGVTYCGDSVEEAKQLIDKVKNYTNLFVLQSGSFLYSNHDIDEVGDYAVNCGLNIILYCGGGFMANNLSVHASQRWGTHFLGIYFSDEPGGKMIDKVTSTLGSTHIYTNGFVSASVFLYRNDTAHGDIDFYPTGVIQVSESLTGTKTVQTFLNKTTNNQTYTATRPYTISSSDTKYYPNGTITHTATKYNESDSSIIESNTYIYQPNGVIHDREGNNVTDQGDISQFSSYQELYALYPLGSYANMADTFTNNTLYDLRLNNQYMNKSIINTDFDNFFTSDYALYWFDYKSGYNTVFAEFVGNESRERHIGLCRGAAETLGKDWGVMVTWKYNQMPYLESGDELYNDLSLAYSSGAKYGIVFTYPNITAYGTLTDGHFLALQRFWNTLKTNPSSFGRAESKAAYVLPADYGFGFRSANDTIWGQFPADDLSAKIYSDILTLTAKYGAGLNILYDGAETAAKLGGYSAVYYYNQTVT
jgi:hypothetical protein